MALFFAAGSACFLIGPFPGYRELVGAAADGVTFFVGSILFTAGGLLQTSLSFHARREHGGGRSAWWAAVIQSAGTLFFNATTYRAMDIALSNYDYTRLVWRPDAFGSICFLVSGLIAYARLSATRLEACARRPRLVAAGGQPAGLRVLRDLRGRGIRGPGVRLGARPRRRELDHLPRRGVLPGVCRGEPQGLIILFG